jgi:hypothetical protein
VKNGMMNGELEMIRKEVTVAEKKGISPDIPGKSENLYKILYLTTRLGFDPGTSRI